MVNATINESLYRRAFEFVNTWYSGFIVKILVAVVVLLIGFIIGRILGRIVHKFLHELQINKVMKSATGFRGSLEDLISKLVSYFIYFLSIIFALNQLGITSTVLYIVLGAIVLVVSVALLLGIKDFIPNVFAGFFLLRNKTVQVGDVIKVQGMQGEVVAMSLVETKIKTNVGDEIFIPNSTLAKSRITKLHKE